MKLKVADWNKKWVGKAVTTPTCNPTDSGGDIYFEGTLTGILSSDGGYGKDSYATRVRVAYIPGVWADWPVDLVEET